MEQKKFINGNAELTVGLDENGVFHYECSGGGEAWIFGIFLVFTFQEKSVIICIKDSEVVEVACDAQDVCVNLRGLVYHVGDCFWFLNANAECVKLGQKQENGLFYVAGDKVSFFLKYVGLWRIIFYFCPSLSDFPNHPDISDAGIGSGCGHPIKRFKYGTEI